MPSNKLVESRIEVLVSTNVVPTDAEESEIRRRNIQHAGRIMEMDAKIEELSITLAGLKQQRDEQRQRLDLSEAVVSRVRRLPPEILGRIFLQSYLDWGQVSPNPNSRYPPLLFGHVCARWRDISHSMPMLWNELYVHSKTTIPSSNLVDLVKEWLSRAHPMPISIKFTNATTSPRDDVFQEALLPFTNSMRNVILCIPLHQIRMLQDMRDGMPLLEDLYIRQVPEPNNHPREVDWEGPPISFEASRQLRKVALFLHGSHRLYHSTIFTIPWAQLIELTLSVSIAAVGISEILGILLVATDLQSFVLSIEMQNDVTDISTLPHCRLHNLQTLDVVVAPNGPIDTFFNSLTLPSLQDLTVKTVRVNLLPVKDMIERSKCSLESLLLWESHTDTLAPFLGCIPTLKTLELQYQTYDPTQCQSLLHLISYRPTDIIRLLPALTTFKLNYLRGVVSSQMVIDMISTRWWPDRNLAPPNLARLESVSIKHTAGNPILENEDQRLREFIKEGLKIKFTGFN